MRGTITEPGTVTVNGMPAAMIAGDVFEATILASASGNSFTVAATDYSNNTTTASYSVAATGGGAGYTFDANGNLTEKVEGSTTWTYEWNAENKLTRVLSNVSEVARFKYDPLGRRVERVAGATTTLWAYGGEDILREAIGSATTKYIQGPGIDEPLAQEDGTGVLSHLHTDGLGSVVKTTGAAGTVTATRRYDAYGNLEAGATNGYAFTGREWDAAANLAYYRARYYDPTIGRFISEDPIPLLSRGYREINAYGYAVNNPVNFTDFSGLAAVKNNWDRPVPYKPEDCPPGTQCPIKLCPPGATCDGIDGLDLPADCKTNPYKVIDTCNGEVDSSGELTLTCGLTRPLQWIRGGRMSDKDMTKATDWAPPNKAPGCQSSCR